MNPHAQEIVEITREMTEGLRNWTKEEKKELLPSYTALLFELGEREE